MNTFQRSSLPLLSYELNQEPGPATSLCLLLAPLSNSFSFVFTVHIFSLQDTHGMLCFVFSELEGTVRGKIMGMISFRLDYGIACYEYMLRMIYPRFITSTLYTR